MNTLLCVLAFMVVFWVLAYHRLPALVWTGVTGLGLGLLTMAGGLAHTALSALWLTFAIAALLLCPTPLRRAL